MKRGNKTYETMGELFLVFASALIGASIAPIETGTFYHAFVIIFAVILIILYISYKNKVK